MQDEAGQRLIEFCQKKALVIAHFWVVSGPWGFPDGAVVKNLPINARDPGDEGLIPGSGRSPGGGNGNPLQNPCLENHMDRGT